MGTTDSCTHVLRQRSGINRVSHFSKIARSGAPLSAIVFNGVPPSVPSFADSRRARTMAIGKEPQTSVGTGWRRSGAAEADSRRLALPFPGTSVPGSPMAPLWGWCKFVPKEKFVPKARYTKARHGNAGSAANHDPVPQGRHATYSPNASAASNGMPDLRIMTSNSASKLRLQWCSAWCSM